MEIDLITQYILTLTPAVSAIIATIVALGVGIGQIKKANIMTTETVTSISNQQMALQTQLIEALVESRRENDELKEQLTRVTAKLEHVHIVDKEV